MQCKWKDCARDVKGKAKYCSGACRTKASRAKSIVTLEAAVSVTNDTLDDVTRPAAVTVEGMVYGRQAVSYEGDMFDTRPEPLDPADTPDQRNRCIYQRPDGSRYLIDATGNTHTRPGPPAPVPTLSDVDLLLRLKSYEGASWVNSPEHKEVLKRRAAQPTGAWT